MATAPPITAPAKTSVKKCRPERILNTAVEITKHCETAAERRRSVLGAERPMRIKSKHMQAVAVKLVCPE
jgi:hypothetical protein